MAVLNGGATCSGVGGYFQFEGIQSALIRRMLPPFVHISAEPSKTELRSSIERLMRELRTPQLGGRLIAEHLSQTLLIEALRLHLAQSSQRSSGWLFALADRNIRAAITAIHDKPAHKWTLETLARVAGMSRSSFAARFKTLVGEPAIDYLTRWRMLLAADLLANKELPISLVAPAVGYESESAFGAAFKRVLGRSPRQYARGNIS